jgi:hypothetical protein
MDEITKQQFKAMYFRHRQPNDGWTPEYWSKHFEPDPVPPMKYKAEPPKSLAHTAMMIVVDFGSREYRMFFLTQDSADRM